VLTQEHPAEPRAAGERSELRPLTRGLLLKRLAAVQPSRHRDAELRGTLHALRSVARRIERLTGEERELDGEISALTRKLAPHLLDEPGIGTLAAAQLLLSWSHPGRVRNEAAFARLAGCAPIPASSGRTIRYRLDRSGDRQLNRALHMILISRRRWHQPTIDYIARRRADGKSSREAKPLLLPQALPRPQPLPPPRTPTDRHLTFIEASLAQASALRPEQRSSRRSHGSLRTRCEESSDDQRPDAQAREGKQADVVERPSEHVTWNDANDREDDSPPAKPSR